MTEKKSDMTSPFTGGAVVLVSGTETMDFRGEKYDIPVSFFRCVDTGEEFTTSEQDNTWTAILYDAYRINHGIPSTEEIVATRKKYGLTLHQMTLIMGFGPNQYSQYEKGQVPSESNGKLIRLAMKKENMMILLKESANNFVTGSSKN